MNVSILHNVTFVYVDRISQQRIAFWQAMEMRFDLLVQRIVIPHNWNPPIVPHMPGAEGLALLQKNRKLLRNRKIDDDSAVQMNVSKVPISLVDLLGTHTDDIESIPFTLAAIFQQSAARAQDLVISIWEMYQTVDIEMCPRSQFDAESKRQRAPPLRKALAAQNLLRSLSSEVYTQKMGHSSRQVVCWFVCCSRCKLSHCCLY